MVRPSWTGRISFGLVNVPVRMFTAVRSHDVHFHQLHQSTKARVRRRRVDEETGEEVSPDEIVKGYEVADGRWIVVDPDELDQLAPESSRAIDLQAFVPESDVDPLYYDRAYYLAPDGDAARRPYRLLATAMARSERAAVATFVMQSREHLAEIRSRDDLLVLSTMHYADEIVDPSQLDTDLGGVEVGDEEVDMARQLIANLERDFAPEEYHDRHQERIREYLQSKADGEEVELPEPGEEPAEVVDLMAALEQSLRRAGGDGADDDLADRSKEELYELAQERDLPGRSSMSKDELVTALRDTDTRESA